MNGLTYDGNGHSRSTAGRDGKAQAHPGTIERRAMPSSMPQPPAMPERTEEQLLSAYREGDKAAFALLVSFVATLYPSWSASRILPAEALRYE